MSELKSCAQCGFAAEMYQDIDKRYCISCSNGNCNTRPLLRRVDLQEAIEAWNTRALTPKQQCADEMYELLETIENDDGKIQEWLWDRIMTKQTARRLALIYCIAFWTLLIYLLC